MIHMLWRKRDSGAVERITEPSAISDFLFQPQTPQASSSTWNKREKRYFFCWQTFLQGGKNYAQYPSQGATVPVDLIKALNSKRTTAKIRGHLYADTVVVPEQKNYM